MLIITFHFLSYSLMYCYLISNSVNCIVWTISYIFGSRTINTQLFNSSLLFIIVIFIRDNMRNHKVHLSPTGLRKRTGLRKCTQQPKLPYVSGTTKVHHQISDNLHATHIYYVVGVTIIVGGEDPGIWHSAKSHQVMEIKDPEHPRRKKNPKGKTI